MPARRDPYSVVSLAITIVRLLFDPTNAAHLTKDTIAACSLAPQTIQRLHAWQTGPRAATAIA